MEHADDFASRVNALKTEAIALRAAGDKVGAIAKVREMKALQAMLEQTSEDAAANEAEQQERKREEALRIEQTRQREAEQRLAAERAAAERAESERVARDMAAQLNDSAAAGGGWGVEDSWGADDGWGIPHERAGAELVVAEEERDATELQAAAEWQGAEESAEASTAWLR